MTVPLAQPNRNPYRTVAQAQAQAGPRGKPVTSRRRVVERGAQWLYSDRTPRTRVVVVESKNPTPPAPKKTAPERRRSKQGQPQKARPPERDYLIASHQRQQERKAKALFKRPHPRPVVEFSIKEGKPSQRIQPWPHENYWANGRFLNLVTRAQWLGLRYTELVRPDAGTGSLVATIGEAVGRLPGQVIEARHIVRRRGYYRLTILEQVCKAIKRRLGISVGFAQFNSS